MTVPFSKDMPHKNVLKLRVFWMLGSIVHEAQYLI